MARIAWASILLVWIPVAPVGPHGQPPSAPSAATYYLDSRSGSDANTGTREDSAWQTLAKVNATAFQPGDRLLLRAGSAWEGSLEPKGSGKPGRPDRGAHEAPPGTAVAAEGNDPSRAPLPPASYHVDCTTGDDASDGQSPASAWRSIARVNRAAAFQPGDRILLKSGCSWRGQLAPKGSGTRELPIRMDRYEEGAAPRIQAGVEDVNALALLNQSFWEISNLELTNRNPEKPNDQTRRGVFVEARGALVEHIHLKNLKIHDVQGVLAVGPNYNTGKDSAGIGFEVTDDANGARFHDLLVDGCDISAVDSTGIYTKGRSRIYPRAEGWDRVKFTGVVLQNNRIHDIGKNAIIVRQLDGGTVQRNTVWDTAYRCESGNQVFALRCYGTVFQYNEGYLNRATADMDGSAFDADLESPATVWQYNYSHDNRFGLITLCTAAPDKDIVVRFNISRNDQGRLLNINYNFAGVSIYNNVFFIPEHLSPQILWETHARSGINFTGTQHYIFENNIIYNLSPTATYNLNPNQGSMRQTWRVLRNNCFFGQHPASEPANLAASEFHEYSGNITAEPQFVQPGSGGIGLATLEGYRLKPSSPCIKAGRAAPNPGAHDFFGNALPDGPLDIGAHQFSAAARK